MNTGTKVSCFTCSAIFVREVTIAFACWLGLICIAKPMPIADRKSIAIGCIGASVAMHCAQPTVVTLVEVALVGEAVSLAVNCLTGVLKPVKCR